MTVRPVMHQVAIQSTFAYHLLILVGIIRVKIMGNVSLQKLGITVNANLEVEEKIVNMLKRLDAVQIHQSLLDH